MKPALAVVVSLPQAAVRHATLFAQPGSGYSYDLLSWLPPFPADEATKRDLAVRRDTVTPFWWGLRTLLKASGRAAGVGWGGAAPAHPAQGMEQGGCASK